MYLGRIQGVGDSRTSEAVDKIADTIKSFSNRDRGYSDWSPSGILDRRFAVKEILLYGVLGYVGIQLLKKLKR
jgi:hypothetical protein